MPELPKTQSTIELLRTESLGGVVQREIERMILSGELAAGSHLNEYTLATKLGVSRGPVREACRALGELGIVQLIPNRGVFVKSMSRADAMEVYDLRAGLTGIAASLLAPIITDAQLTRLDGFLDEMERAAEDGDFAAFYPLNIAFHDFIVEATGNGRLLKTHRGLVKEFQLFRPHGLVQRGALVASNAEHRAIVAALKARDGRRAYDVSFDHVISGKARLLTALDAISGNTETQEAT